MDRLAPALLGFDSSGSNELTNYCAGMPHLSLAGLAENWLLKECGHLHWQAIARAQNLAEPAFRDLAGNKTYAAFTAVRISEARLDAVAEHDMFSIAVRSTPTGRTRHYSTQEVNARGECIARVDMLSAFVRRERWGSNHSVVKTPLGGCADQPSDAPLAAQAQAMQDWSRAMREGQLGEWSANIPADSAAGPAPVSFTPCPSSDFNGAGFLYFANFQNLVDRAECNWLGARAALPCVTRARELVFYGNIDPGDTVQASVEAWSESETEIAHWCRLHRGSDGQRIADVLTRKRRLSNWPIPERR